MPTISGFYGIVIEMFWRDHNPPHFHARYGEREALIRIDNFGIWQGSLPNRARRLVIQSARLHQDELVENWELARQQQPLRPIDPLD